MKPLRAMNWDSGITTAILCTLVVFMIVPEDFDYESLGSPMPQAGNLTSRLVWMTLLGASSLIVLRWWSLAGAILRRLNPFFLAFGALAVASLLWSAEPDFTFRRLIRVSTILLASLAFVIVHGCRIQAALRIMITAALIASIAMVVLYPALALERSVSAELAGAWHGIATQKNGLGSLAAMGTILWLHAALTREGSWPGIALGASASLLCLLYSRSSTSMLTTAFVAPLLVLLLRSPRGMRPFMPWMIGLVVLGLLLYSLAVLRISPGSELLLRPVEMVTDKDASFSGRTAVWRIVTEHIARSPVLGSGYGAYWIGPVSGSASYEHVARLHFYPTEAHNGYLDVINDLGMLGGACLLGYLFVYVRQSLRVYAHARPQGAIYLGLFIEQLLENMSESRWLNALSVAFVIMTLATVGLARAQLELQLIARERARFRQYEHRAGVVHSRPAAVPAR